MTLTVSPFFRCATASPFKPAWPRTLTSFTVTSAGPGESVTVGSLIFLTGARFFTGLGFSGAGVGVVSAGAAVGAADCVSAAGDVAGGGISGNAFELLSCAIAPVAIITPKINQQFVF